MFASLSLLGDLFLGEWPPPGSARTRGVPHPPPSAMRRRAALARSFENSTGVFRGLIASGIAAESRIARALLVRLCARAAGLGGGMGVFLAEPIVDELRSVADAPDDSGDQARRVLEVLVPLMYRPAMKVRPGFELSFFVLSGILLRVLVCFRITVG